MFWMEDMEATWASIRSASYYVQFYNHRMVCSMSLAIILLLYTVVHKKRATLFLTITTMFHGRFLHLLYQWKQE